MPLPEPRTSTAPHFYKYSNANHLEWLKDILLKHELYLPNLRGLNDNNDGLPHLALQSEEDMTAYFCDNVHRYRPDLSAQELPQEREVIRHNVKMHGPAALQRIMVRILDKELEGYRIYSMTKRFDRMNMWALYADNHRGYCLEFENTGDLFCHAKDVAYLEPSEMEIFIDDPTLRKGYFFFCKTKDWITEDEVRLVQSRVDPPNKVKINAKWLSRIIIGKDMTPETEVQIRKWAKQREPELPVAKAGYDAVSRSINIRTEKE